MAPAAWLWVAAGLTLLVAWLLYRELRRPKYLITLQKQTNVNRQPETLTIQANLPRSAGPSDVWMEAELMALAATSRMQSINQDIIDETAEESAAIARRRDELQAERETHRALRTRRKLARRLGKPVTDVTDEEVQAAIAQARAQLDGTGG